MDLRTRYLGLELRSPLVASASPLTGNLDGLRRLEQAGAGAVVLPSLFEEQVTHELLETERLLLTGADSHPEAASYLPEMDDYNHGPWAYLSLVQKATKVIGIPVIASLNGVTPGGWTRHARWLEEAGAAAIELNLYQVAVDSETTASELEARDLEVIPEELRLPLRWIAILRGRTSASLAASGGIHSGHDAAKALAAGADVATTTSALLRHGPGHLVDMERQLVACLTQREVASVAELRGSLCQEAVPDPSAFERANYMRTLLSWSTPVA